MNQVKFAQQIAYGFGTHFGSEATSAEFGHFGPVLFFGQQLLFFKIGIARNGDDIVLEVNYFFQATGLHRQQVTQTTRHGFEEPNVNHRSGELDVAHSFTANARVSDFNATAIANHAFVLHAAVLTTSTLPVLFRAENSLAEQTVFFRSVRTVVDRFRLLHFAHRPTADVVWAS